MKEILIRFIRGTAWDSKIIEYRTRAWCSHVEAIVTADEDLTIGAMLHGGVRYRSIKDPVYNGVKRWEIWRIPVRDEQYDRFYNFLHEQCEKPYDWRAIVSFGLGERDWQEKDSWFCSELLVAGGVDAKLWSWPAQAVIDRVDPGVGYLLFATLPGAHL